MIFYSTGACGISVRMGQDEEIVSGLRRMLGEQRVLTSKVDIIPYCSDYFHRDSFSTLGSWPLCAVLPETTEEVSEIVKLAAKHRTPIVPRGGGSNQVGGVMPVDRSIVISTSRMNKVIEIDSLNMMVTAQPGVTLKEIDEILDSFGLTLAQEQGSYKVANLGGAISTNGFSLRHNRYRDIGENVIALEVVLGDGRILRTGRKVCSNSSGYPLHKIFVGAEGTLGIITEVTLSVMPKPERELAVLATFTDWDSAQRTAWKFIDSGINYAGGFAIESMREEFGKKIPVVLVGLEGTKEEVEAQEKIVRRMLEESGGEIQDSDLAWSYWRLQRTFWCGAVDDDTNGDDLVAAMPLQYYDEARERMERDVYPKYGIQSNPDDFKVVLIGRRPLVAFNFVYKMNEISYEQLKEMFGEMMAIVSEYGGVGPGCHAVGELLKDFISMEHDKTRLAVMRELKKVFDPYDIMNPGKKFVP